MPPVMLPLADAAPGQTPVVALTPSGLAGWLKTQSPSTVAWVAQTRFKGALGQAQVLPDPVGGVGGVICGLGAAPDVWSFAALYAALAPGGYRLDLNHAEAAEAAKLPTTAALGVALGAYVFSRYRGDGKAKNGEQATVAWPEGADRALVRNLAEATYFARDLINTPANDLGPAELAAAASALADRFGASCTVTVGDALLAAKLSLIHAVGGAAEESRAPRLIDITWSPPGRAASLPKVTLVGKGVCFDTGGLDLKPSGNMLLMKKDMGGAAIVLGLAQAIMAGGLPLCLRVLVPAVENSVSAGAMRPGDVFPSRAGLSVEIGNTDAEGRLILADALHLAGGDAPDLLIDCATLTGSARAALGPDIAALFTDDDRFAADLTRHGWAQSDPVWRLPLHAPYRALLDSSIADINNAAKGQMAGAITAALFLKEFTAGAKVWAHLDLYAWNGKKRPGRPEGGRGHRASRALCRHCRALRLSNQVRTAAASTTSKESAAAISALV